MTPLLSLEGVTVSYWRGPRELRVLRGVSLDVNPGELHGVYGRRGAGKTTLLRVAAGFEAPQQGRVAFGGVDLASLSRNQRAKLLRTSLAWVDRRGQQSQELNVRAYVALPLYRSFGKVEAQRRACALLDRIGVADAAEERWDDLPDTARTLVSIAHALVRQPRVLLVDDPTGGLNVIDRERVMSVLRATAEDDGCSVLMAVPDFPAMHHADKIRSLSRGRLVMPAQRPQQDDGPEGTVVEFPGERSA